MNHARAKARAPEGPVQWASEAPPGSEPPRDVIERVGLWTCDVRVTHAPGQDADVGQVVRASIRRLQAYSKPTATARLELRRLPGRSWSTGWLDAGDAARLDARLA
jgi:hypothetical protein